MPTKQQREQAFHDRAFTESTRQHLWGYYKTTRASRQAFRDTLAAEGLSGKRVLEYGSGATAQAFFLAAEGARVVGIDISPVAVEQGRRRAAEQQLADRVTFEVMDAESLAFPDDSFDIVCGAGILHHLELATAYREVGRVLQPRGTAVFVEPLGHNPLINAYRRRTPGLRTPDEHPLLMDDLERARNHFRTVELDFFHLASLAAIPVRDRARFGQVLALLDAVDRGLFRLLPPLRRHAWMVVMRMGEPTKTGASTT
jgi:SAM-dependent methyltransferase